MVNWEVHEIGMSLLEVVTMPGNFSSIAGEFIISSIPRHCDKLVKNLYHNGHPDLIPAVRYDGNCESASIPWTTFCLLASGRDGPSCP